MMQPPYSIVELATRRLVLRPWLANEATTMKLLADDKEVAAPTLSLPHPYPLEAAKGFIASHGPAAERGEALIWALASLNGVPIGNISVVFSQEHERGEIGYWLGRQQSGGVLGLRPRSDHSVADVARGGAPREMAAGALTAALHYLLALLDTWILIMGAAKDPFEDLQPRWLKGLLRLRRFDRPPGCPRSCARALGGFGDMCQGSRAR
jgi:GNAT acetyltransferase-like protein